MIGIAVGGDNSAVISIGSSQVAPFAQHAVNDAAHGRDIGREVRRQARRRRHQGRSRASR